MQNETVSIIIPVYNNEKHIGKCIRSILDQSYTDLEILIINDGSTDASGKILKQFAQEDQRIRLFHQKNAGVAAARNLGLDHAAGTFLTFIDADDYIGKDYILHLYRRMKSQNAELVICGLTFVKEDGTTIQTINPAFYQRFKNEEWTFRISAVCSHFYLRKLWEDYHIRFQIGERGEDMPISLFFSAVCSRITTLPEAEYYYVQHAESAMHNFQGLRKFRLPYKALENAIQSVNQYGLKNSSEFYELFVLRILCTCYFSLARGASKAHMSELCDYIIRITGQYFPDYYKNPLTGLFSHYNAPFSQKAAVFIMKNLIKTRMLYPIGTLLSGRQKED